MPVYDDIVRKAEELGCEEWVETLNHFEERLNGENPSPHNWYLTDMRHISNLASAQWQGFVTDDNYDKVMELEDEVIYWLEDLLGVESLWE